MRYSYLVEGAPLRVLNTVVFFIHCKTKEDPFLGRVMRKLSYERIGTE